MCDELENKIIFGKYKLIKKIGEGSFGKIYQSINVNTKQEYALKLEKRNENENILEAEACIISYLQGTGIPIVKSYGYSNNHNVLVMELLGNSLEELFQKFDKKFSLKTVCMLADQILNRIEHIHNKSFIHRDIKPDNLIIGKDNKSHIIYLIDFGLAKKYRSSKTYTHISYKNNKRLTGTARYASINALKGFEQSRRDDLESLGYVFIYLLKGCLPWQGLKVPANEDRYAIIHEKKSQISIHELCSEIPNEFTQYFEYVRNLTFEEEPDYLYLKSLFVNVMKYNDYEYDNIFDWTYDIKKINLDNDSNNVFQITQPTIALSPISTKNNDGKHNNKIDQGLSPKLHRTKCINHNKCCIY